MTGLEDLLKSVGKGGGGGLGNVLGGGGGGLGGGLGGILGSLLGGGGIARLLPMVIGMLAGGGLGKILGGMKAQGLSSQADSWVSTGDNEPIGADDVRRIIDPAELSRIANELGVSEDEAAEALSEVLPQAVDHVTPEGAVPEDSDVDSALDRLKGLLG
ncbi:MAG: DUF937 domain-containing protein [Actinobacteria bacterium]|nr:DUF937 domain-containing protein [Actinomycetota bacterium]